MKGEADGHRPHRSALVQEQRKQRSGLRGNSTPPRRRGGGARFKGSRQNSAHLQPARMGVLPDRRQERGIRPSRSLGRPSRHLSAGGEGGRGAPHSPAPPVSALRARQVNGLGEEQRAVVLAGPPPSACLTSGSRPS